MAERSARRYLALRTGVTAAAGITSATFARGLLPRSTSDQAIVTGTTAAYGIGAGTVAVSAIEATAELVTTGRGRGNPEDATLLAAGVLAGAGYVLSRALPNTHETPLPVATAQAAAWALAGGSTAATLVIATDRVIRRTVGPRGPAVSVAVSAALGGVISVVRVRQRERRALKLGQAERRPAASSVSATTLAKSVGLGAAVGSGLIAIAGAEFLLAEGTTKVATRLLGRSQDVTPLVGHAAVAAALVPAGGWGLTRLRRRLTHADDVVEPAYPEPPTSPHVTAGPASSVSFADIGKEGRRFVLMALTAEQIASVMGEPALEPIRAVAGFESAATPEDRASIALAELEALGAYERAVIVVAAPTGVGYVSYSFAEALEYLTRGNCAIIVPQYALIPSALALHQTDAGVAMQALILRGIRDRIARLPPDRRPRLLQFGESLGAQVALDVAADGTATFDTLGLDGGLYLGTPFRTKLWTRWFADPDRVDPRGILGCVPRADQIPSLPRSVRHVQVVHDDDPINKFSYEAIVRRPWWLGPPETRPPGVPREVSFRPVVTFVISLADLKNGMDTKPGQFVRVAHDYRIELCDAVRLTFRLPASEDQIARIERALRDREREWAARRMVARRFDSARRSVIGQLSSWGVDPSTVGLDDQSAAKLARGDISGLLSKLGSSGPPA